MSKLWDFFHNAGSAEGAGTKAPCETETLTAHCAGALGVLCRYIYEDAEAHGLWEVREQTVEHKTATALNRITLELIEATQASSDRDHLAEELADVIITTISAAGFLGMDIAGEVLRKVAINHDRPYQHRGEGGNS